jgi:hypothetical protein
VEVLGTASTQRRLAQMERKFIRIFHCIESGYNQAAISWGGRTPNMRGSHGRAMTEENKLKLAAARKVEATSWE